VHRRVEVTLKSQILRVWTVVVFDTKLFNLFLVGIEYILANLALGIAQWYMFNLPVHGPVCLILPNVQRLLPQNDLTVVRIVILLRRIEVTQHKSEGDIFFGYKLRRGVRITYSNDGILLNLILIPQNEVS